MVRGSFTNLRLSIPCSSHAEDRLYVKPWEFTPWEAIHANNVWQIAESLAAGRPCFLEEDAWQAIPDGILEFPLLPKGPQLYHSIFSHFAAVPGLLKSVRLKVAADPPDLYLLSQADNLHQHMEQWYIDYTSADGNLRQPVVAINPKGSLVLNIYEYHDTISASTITTYYAYILLLNRAIESLRPQQSYAADNLQLAEAICMSVEYCSRAGYCGAQTMRFSLPIAQSVLPTTYQGWVTSKIAQFSGSLDATRMIQVLNY